MRRVPVVLAGLTLLLGCGDGETNDRRGYTKAPLERPGVTIDAEARTEMNRLGQPNLPRAEWLEPPAADSAAATGS